MDITDCDGWTPIHYASAFVPDVGLLHRMLLETGALITLAANVVDANAGGPGSAPFGRDRLP